MVGGGVMELRIASGREHQVEAGPRGGWGIIQTRFNIKTKVV
jgi:hypothetical protein